MTRRGGDIGKWILTFFSAFQSPQLSARNCQQPTPTIGNQTTPHWVFPNLFLGYPKDTKAETFCIFRNSGISATGLYDVGLYHQAKNYRINLENRGSTEWNTQVALVQYKLSLSKSHHFSMGLGGVSLGGSVAKGHSALRGAGLLNLQYIVQGEKTGTWMVNYRSCITPEKQFFKQWALGYPAESMAGALQYEQALFQLVWVAPQNSNNKSARALPRDHKTLPFVHLHYGAQRQFLEVGIMKPLGLHCQGMLALNSTEQPLRWGIIYNKKSWSGGLDAQWLRPLGMCVGWQVRYRWQ